MLFTMLTLLQTLNLRSTLSFSSQGASHVQNGAVLTAHVRQSQLVSSALAFALLRSDGTVVSWGNAIDGGDSSAVQDELKDAEGALKGGVGSSLPHACFCCSYFFMVASGSNSNQWKILEK